jgi:hypothetical protein
MLEHSIARARWRGFLDTQFNFAVRTHYGTVRTLLSRGSREMGRLPCAFRHSLYALVDAMVMHRLIRGCEPLKPS